MSHHDYKKCELPFIPSFIFCEYYVITWGEISEKDYYRSLGRDPLQLFYCQQCSRWLFKWKGGRKQADK